MLTRKWFIRLALLIGVAAFGGATITGCKSSSSSCGDSDCKTKH